MENFTEIKTSIGKKVEDFVNYISSTLSGLFDVILFGASRSLNGIDDFLVLMLLFVFILIIFALGWYFQSLLSGAIFGIFIFLVGTFGLWGDMMTTIAIILAAVGISLIVGIPMGVWMSFNKIISNIMRPILD